MTARAWQLSATRRRGSANRRSRSGTERIIGGQNTNRLDSVELLLKQGCRINLEIEAVDRHKAGITSPVASTCRQDPVRGCWLTFGLAPGAADECCFLENGKWRRSSRQPPPEAGPAVTRSLGTNTDLTELDYCSFEVAAGPGKENW